MNNMQQNVLKSYYEVYGKRPLRKISQDTGIQTTRIFRILNGSEMKISEYERFKNLIKKNEKNENTVISMNQYEDLLTVKMKQEIYKLIERLVSKRKIQLNSISI